MRRRRRPAVPRCVHAKVLRGRVWLTDNEGRTASAPWGGGELTLQDVFRLHEVLAGDYAFDEQAESAWLIDFDAPDAGAERAPLGRTVERLVESATASVAPDLRDLLAEWAADVHHIEGRWARLRWAIGLRFWTVRALRREARTGERDVPRRA